MNRRFQQTDFWCDFKCSHGWKKISFQNINILIRSFKKGPVSFSLAYVPMAPEYIPVSKIPGFSQQAQDEVDYLKKIGSFTDNIKSLIPSNTICIRYDIPLDFPFVELRDDYLKRFDELRNYAKVNIKKSFVDIQPPDSTFIDLSLSQQQILENMKSKWRYNIRYAQKHGVTVRMVNAQSQDFEKSLDSFYELYKTTSSRDGIGIHPKSYYKDLIEQSLKSDDTKITLFIASHEKDDLAAIITLFNKDEAIYLYGCSGNLKRNLMPTYAVQWQAIMEAKKFGSKIYDFYGIPPVNDENHPMHGLYLFKTGFGGYEVHRPGSFDVPLKPVYKLYSLAERLRAFYHKVFLKKIRGR